MSQQPPSVPEFMRVDQLLDRLQALEKRHEQLGKVSHAHGVRTAIELIKRDLAQARRPPAKN